MPTTYDVRETLADMPDAARDYIMQLLRGGSDDEPTDGPQGEAGDPAAYASEWPDPADYGLTETQCQHYVDQALPRIVQTVGGPGYHVTPPPAGASYQQVVEHYTTQVQQIAGDYYEVTGDGNLVGHGNVGATGDGASLAYGHGAQAQSQYGDGNLQVGDGIDDSVVGQGAQGVASGGGDVGAAAFGGDATGTTGDGSPAGDVTFGDVGGNVNLGGDQLNAQDSFNQDNDLLDVDDSFNQDNDNVINDSFNQDNDVIDDKDVVDDKDLIDDKDVIDIA